MSEALVLGVVREAIQTAVIISLPMLVVGLIVGIAVSIVQTVTSVQDNILAFLPRAAAIFIVFAFTFPWMLRVATGFTAALVRRLPELVR
jgi:flagellar biosynthetic protein FliQ